MRSELEYGNDDETWEQQLAREAHEREVARYKRRQATGRDSLRTMEEMAELETAKTKQERDRIERAHRALRHIPEEE